MAKSSIFFMQAPPKSGLAGAVKRVRATNVAKKRTGAAGQLQKLLNDPLTLLKTAAPKPGSNRKTARVEVTFITPKGGG